MYYTFRDIRDIRYIRYFDTNYKKRYRPFKTLKWKIIHISQNIRVKETMTHGYF